MSQAPFFLANLQCYDRPMVHNTHSESVLGDIQLLEYMRASRGLVEGNFDHDCKDTTLGV